MGRDFAKHPVGLAPLSWANGRSASASCWNETRTITCRPFTSTRSLWRSGKSRPSPYFAWSVAR